MYRVSGTPTVSSPTTTTFPISFLDKTCNVEVGSGTSSLNMRNLDEDVTISAPYLSNNPSSANTLPFGEITITESGSYAFSMRLYGRISQDKQARLPFYIYLQKNDKATVLDAAEIDIVTVPAGGYSDYSHTITLGGAYETGDRVIISMHRAFGDGAPNWTLKYGEGYDKSPIRTSLIYWKL